MSAPSACDGSASRQQFAALLDRLSDVLADTARLADQHAQRLADRHDDRAGQVERQRAQRA
jgi:ElaB/YqjD/DUF883 family membrane-anchored ribosome-binding protein